MNILRITFLIIMIPFSLLSKGKSIDLNLVDSIQVPEDIVDIEITEDGRYAMFKSGEADFWNGKYRLDLLSLETGEKIWNNNWLPSKPTVFTDYGVLVAKGHEILFYDLQSGKELKKFKGIYAWHDISDDILIAHIGRKKLAGYRISTGKKIWETKKSNEDEMIWEEVSRPDSTHLVFHSETVGKIDLTTGEHISYPLKRKINDNGGNAARLGLAVLFGAVGVATGLTYIPYSIFSHYEMLGSNVAYDGDGRYYVADRENIVCLDENMNEIWKNVHPDKTGSTSRIYICGDNIDLLNEGAGSLNGTVKKVGRAFWSSIDRNTGEDKNFNLLPDKWDEEFLGKDYLRFIPDSLYYCQKHADKFINIEHNSNAYPVFTQDGVAVMIDKDMNYGDAWYIDGLYYKVCDEPDGILICKIHGMPEYLKIDFEGNVMEAWHPDISLIISKHIGTFVVKDDYLYTPGNISDFVVTIPTK